MLAPEPGTPLFDQLGDKLAYDGYAGPYNAFLVGIDDERLVTEHRDIFSTYHYYEAAMPREDHIFAVEAVDVFRRLGPAILKYWLRVYDGQLSKLVFALRSWARGNAHFNQPDDALIEEYARESFGARHHLTSLVRYALCVNGKQRAPDTLRESKPTSFDPRQPYAPGSQFRVLSEIHDFDALLNRIQTEWDRGSLLDESESGELGTYLISFANGSATSYRIDAGMEALLELFSPPRSCSEVARLIQEIDGARGIDASYFAPLVEAGILVAAAPA
jgi:hypothetical protein